MSVRTTRLAIPLLAAAACSPSAPSAPADPANAGPSQAVVLEVPAALEPATQAATPEPEAAEIVRDQASTRSTIDAVLAIEEAPAPSPDTEATVSAPQRPTMTLTAEQAQLRGGGGSSAVLGGNTGSLGLGAASGSATVTTYGRGRGVATTQHGRVHAIGGLDVVANRENFEHYGFNAWTDPRVDNLATFAIDVDTASWALARRNLNAAVLPDPASVRVEEFINAFDYGYEGPAWNDETPFSVNLEAAPSRFGEGRQLLRVGIQGRDTDPADRAPANLVFLIDVSGSMSSADKLPLVKYALRALLAGLGPDDRLSIVTYAGRADTLLAPTYIRDRQAILAAIDGLTSGGSTNGADGIRTAYELAQRHAVAGGTNRVIWCSDGDLNVGMRGDELLAFIEENGRRGVALTTLGFGSGNYNDRDMERFANRGDGNYHYIDDRNEALRVLGEELSGTLETIARDVKIQVEVDPTVVASYRLVGYENRDVADADFRNDAVDAGEIGSGHSVTALLELELQPDARLAATSPLATVRVRYERPDEEGEGREIAETIRFGELHARFDDASPAFRLAAAVAEFAEVLRMSEFVEDSDLRAVESVVRSATTDADLRAEELAALVSQARALRP